MRWSYRVISDCPPCPNVPGSLVQEKERGKGTGPISVLSLIEAIGIIHNHNTLRNGGWSDANLASSLFLLSSLISCRQLLNMILFFSVLPSTCYSCLHSFFLWVSVRRAPCFSFLTFISIQVGIHKCVSMWTFLSWDTFFATVTLLSTLAPLGKLAYKHSVRLNPILPHQRHIRCLQSVYSPLWSLITFQCPGSYCTNQLPCSKHLCTKPLGNRGTYSVIIRQSGWRVSNGTDWTEKNWEF